MLLATQPCIRRLRRLMYENSRRSLLETAGRQDAVRPVYINLRRFAIKVIIIRCKFFFLCIGREPNTRPANNCLQIMVCSCTMSSNFVSLQIIFCSCVNETTLFSFLRSLLRENGRSLRFPKIFLTKTNPVIE